MPMGIKNRGMCSQQVIQQIRKCVSDKSVVAVVLRVDSPGGEATASDLMWREICQLAAKKPVVASMGDVAASGLSPILLMLSWCLILQNRGRTCLV